VDLAVIDGEERRRGGLLSIAGNALSRFDKRPAACASQTRVSRSSS
jgi:hypothetical protein